MRIEKFLYDIGADERLSEKPLNRLEKIATPLAKSGPTLSSPSTLESLKAALQNFEECDLKKTATNLVFGDGNPNAAIMLVGEAPGAEEDRQGKPFVGLSGQLLTRIFESIGLTREKDLYISNVINWRPPGNRQPTSQEIAACLPFIKRHIELVNPKILILVGGTATKALLSDKEGITKIRGKWFEYMSPGLKAPIKMTAIYHPSYLLRSPSRKRDVWMDVLTIKDALQDLK
jgi:DNA polymerase